MVFLEDSTSAKQEALSFINYYQNRATIILESIPVDQKAYINNTKLA